MSPLATATRGWRCRHMTSRPRAMRSRRARPRWRSGGAARDRRRRDPYTVATETWRSSQPDLPPPPLAFELASNDTRRVELVVNEGDNAPLPIATTTLQMPSVALRFYNSGSPLTLLYGNSRATQPQYDLALLAPRVLGEPASDLGLPALSAAPSESSSLDVKIFWIALAVVTLVLFA